MAESKMVPELRFTGFTEPWEQRKFGDVFEEYSEKNHAELPALMIVQGGGTIRRDESDRSLQYDKDSLSTYKMVNEGDFIVHLRSFEGGLEKATTSGIISPAYHTFHGEGTDSQFYYLYFRSKKFIDQDLKPHVYGIRDGRSIDIEGMKTIDIPWTSFDEQRAIGSYIEKLDKLIALHQQKYNKLLALKKSMLVKMFPKAGKDVPEIHFAGFTAPWEQHKFGDDLISIQTGTNKLGSEQGKGIPLLKMGNIQRGYFLLEKLEYLSDAEEVEPENIACYGDFFFNTRNTLELVGKGATWTENSGKYAFNSNIARSKLRDIDTIFLTIFTIQTE